MPKHSLLISGPILSEDVEIVRECLDNGLRVIILSDDATKDALLEEYPDYVDNHLLQTFYYDGGISLRIADGNLNDCIHDFLKVSEYVKLFNSEQYVIEHSRDKHIIITASAGTGKTSVMIDRILYLLDVEEVDPSDITMITFTNEATNQMMFRLQEAIITRFKLTRSVKFIEMLEKSSRINISTIDSFSYSLLKRLGQIVGYSSNISISSNALDINNALSNILNECYRSGNRVKDCLGANMHEVQSIIKSFYSKLASLGIIGEDVGKMDWGTTADKDSNNLQNTLRKGISELEEYMAARRYSENTVALNDLMHELSRVLEAYDDPPNLGIKYLFIDEFQDTSDEQIRLISNITIKTDSSLFVVGDPKQSIYRFRGADDSAFDTLKRNLNERGIKYVKEYSLVNNYRTDAKVLNNLNLRFKSWSNNNLLQNFDSLIPCKGDLKGTVRIKRIKKDDLNLNITKDLRIALEDVNEQKKNGKKYEKVVVLVRSNWQLDEIATICDVNGIPMVTRRNNPLYTSDAVRDLYSMVTSYVYPDDPVSLFNYLETAYVPKKMKIDVLKLIESNGDSSILLDILHNYINRTSWESYKTRFKNESALSVIRDMLDDTNILDNYVSKLKSQGISDENTLKIRIRSYKANLDKVLAILHSRFPDDGLDLPHIQQFLSLSIATNRDELEEELDYSDLNVAYCMTIHKAKGLEFDTVIIPFDRRLSSEPRSEIVVSSDRKSIGWLYYNDSMHNSLYKTIKEEELLRTKQEETRILYVAMTRTKRNLLAYTYWHNEDYSWSSLLED